MAGGRVEPGRLFFDSAGRIGRAPFVGAVLVLVAVFAGYEAAVRGPARLATAWLVHPVLAVCGASLLSKRLHDRGRAGWWAALVLLAFVLAWPAPRGVAGWAAVVVLAVAAIELGLRPGVAGANRYGPPAS